MKAYFFDHFAAAAVGGMTANSSPALCCSRALCTNELVHGSLLNVDALCKALILGFCRTRERAAARCCTFPADDAAAATAVLVMRSVLTFMAVQAGMSSEVEVWKHGRDKTRRRRRAKTRLANNES